MKRGLIFHYIIFIINLISVYRYFELREWKLFEKGNCCFLHAPVFLSLNVNQ